MSVTTERPDFSGEWTLNRQASTLSPGADGVLSAVWYIEHRDPTFRHKASFLTAGDPIQFEYELQSDGREVVATQPGATSASRRGRGLFERVHIEWACRAGPTFR